MNRDKIPSEGLEYHETVVGPHWEGPPAPKERGAVLSFKVLWQWLIGRISREM